MKTVKIIFGFLLLYGAGTEYADTSRNFGTFFDPIIILLSLLFILLCAWLIGSGITKQKFKIKSFNFLKYSFISFVIFLFFAFISFASFNIPEEYVEYNGLKISVGECIYGNRNTIPDKEERLKYCSCLAERLSNFDKVKIKYEQELEKGEIDNIINKIQQEEYYDSLMIDECSKSIEFRWTDGIATGIKNRMLQELSGTEFEQTNDIEEYCDCVIEEYRKLSLKEINKEDFHRSLKAISIDRICTEKSKKE